MKRFFIKGAVFISPLLLLLLFVEYKLSKIPNGYNTKKEFLERHISEYEVLVTGTSHGFYGINPKYMDCKAYNVAYVGQSLYYDAQLVEKYLDRMKNLKLIILTVSYHSLEYRMSHNPENWRRDFYLKYYGIPREDGDSSLIELSQYSYLALYGFRATQQYARSGFRVNGEAEGNGAGNLGNQSSMDDADAKKRVERLHSMMKPEFFDDNIRLLENLLKDLKAKNIAVVIVTVPVSKAYRDNFYTDKYERMQSGISYLCQKYHVEYFNYLFDERFTAADFRESSHLNARGAEKFTRIIKEEFVQSYIDKLPGYAMTALQRERAGQ
jgi:RNase H-fold protein (predicted Holliday junction resolvase)